MIRVFVLVELLAIIALLAGIPVPVAGTIALIVATPVSATAIYRIWKTDKSGTGIVDVVFLLLTWTTLPCLLLLQASGGVGENVFRFVVAVRVFAMVSIWRLSAEWHKHSNSCVDSTDNRDLERVSNP